MSNSSGGGEEETLGGNLTGFLTAIEEEMMRLENQRDIIESEKDIEEINGKIEELEQLRVEACLLMEFEEDRGE